MKVLVDNALHHSSVHICQPDAHVGSHHKEGSEYGDVEGFLGFPGGNRDFEEDLDSLKEY